MAACAKPEPASRSDAIDRGRLAIQLQAPDLEIETLRYRVTRGNDFSREGVVPLGSTETFVLQLATLPVGSAYALALDADAKFVTRNVPTRCRAKLPFEIIAEQTTTVAVRFRCDGDALLIGSAHDGGSTNACPSVIAIHALPASAPLGREVTLRADVVDANDGPTPLVQTWSAPSGMLTTPSSAKTGFVCTEDGVVKASFNVSDGDAACTDTAAFVYVTCGNASAADAARLLAGAAGTVSGPGASGAGGCGGNG